MHNLTTASRLHGPFAASRITDADTDLVVVQRPGLGVAGSVYLHLGRLVFAFDRLQSGLLHEVQIDVTPTGAPDLWLDQLRHAVFGSWTEAIDDLPPGAEDVGLDWPGIEDSDLTNLLHSLACLVDDGERLRRAEDASLKDRLTVIERMAIEPEASTLCMGAHAAELLVESAKLAQIIGGWPAALIAELRVADPGGVVTQSDRLYRFDPDSAVRFEGLRTQLRRGIPQLPGEIQADAVALADRLDQVRMVAMPWMIRHDWIPLTRRINEALQGLSSAPGDPRLSGVSAARTIAWAALTVAGSTGDSEILGDLWTAVAAQWDLARNDRLAIVARHLAMEPPAPRAVWPDFSRAEFIRRQVPGGTMSNAASFFSAGDGHFNDDESWHERDAANTATVV